MIGWYAHHHGHGHLSRARAVAPHLADVTVFSSIDAPDVQRLPLDVGDDPGPVPTDYLHHAPLGVAGLTGRMATLADWIGRVRPRLFVVDVSVEVATFARLMGIPTVLVRQHGRRDDPPHTMAHHHATALLAPYGPELEDPWVPRWMRDRTLYAGGFSRMDGRPVDRGASRRRLGVDLARRLVVVQPGGDGASDWQPEMALTPGWDWIVLGPADPAAPPPTADTTVRRMGWQDDPWDWLCAADVVVTHAGHNSVMEGAAARRPMVVIPRGRPFDEQHMKADALARTGAAILRPTWPPPHEWSTVLEAAAAFVPDVQLVDGDGARRAAAMLETIANHRVEVPA